MRVHRSIALGFGLALVVAMAPAIAVTVRPPSAREMHAAQCVAALEAETEYLAAKVKSGDEKVRSRLLERLESGAAFVGDAYVRGDRDETRARALANAALESQKSLPAAELASLQMSCSAEGAKLLAGANALERAVVRRVAKKRMDRLLAS